MDYNELITNLEKIAREAAQFMLSGVDRESQVKTSARDIVTVADIKSQNLIIKRLAALYPEVMILSEEMPEDERKKVYDKNLTAFIIDPIDGTYNFKRDMRESALSIGYVVNGEPLAGVVCDPYRGELYSAIKGKGAFRNGQLIHVSGQTDIAGSSIAISNSYDDEAMARNLKRHLAIYEQSGVMPWTNCPGSGVLILTYIACGRMDAYHHNGIKPWDCAAAFLIVREAGGVVVTLSGAEARFTTPTLLAGNPVVVQKMQEIFAEIPARLLH